MRRTIPTGTLSIIFAIIAMSTIILSEDIPYRNITVYPVPPRLTKEQAEAIRRGAEDGDPESQLYYGALHANGHYGEVRFDIAAEYYERAAARGNRKAKRNLATLLQHGVGVQKDERRALQLYMEAAAQGDAAALLGISSFYFVNKISLVSELLKWPCKPGTPHPMNMGGYLAWRYRALLSFGPPDGTFREERTWFWPEYCRNDLVFQDENKLILHLREMATTGKSHEAQLSLAQVYLGMVEDPVIVDDTSDSRRAAIHQTGWRTRKTSREAVNWVVHFWLTLAAENGNEYACSLVGDSRNPFPLYSLFPENRRFADLRTGRVEKIQTGPVLENSSEEYFHFLSARMKAVPSLFRDDGNNTQMAILAKQGNPYAILHIKERDIRSIADAKWYTEPDEEDRDELLSRENPYIQLLHIERMLELHCEETPLFNELFLSIIKNGDVCSRLNLYQRVVLPRLAGFICVEEQQTQERRNDLTDENTRKSLESMLACLAGVPGERDTVKRLLSLWVQGKRMCDMPTAIDLFGADENARFDTASRMKNMSILTEFCNARLLVDRKPMWSSPAGSRKTTDTTTTEEEMSYRKIMTLFSYPEWNTIYTQNREISIERLLLDTL